MDFDIPEEISLRYSNLEVIGTGSEGVVFKGESKIDSKAYALKILRRDALQSFQKFGELNFSTTATHPNILSALNFFYCSDGRVALAFPFMSEGSLRNMLDQGKSFSSAEILQIAISVLEGLDHLHEKKIIHCDIKSDNILVNIETGESFYRIADFGIATRIGESHLRTAARNGSPAYMAPEAFYDSLLPNADLYSLGIVLFELCTGGVPFSGTAREICSAHISKPIDLSVIKDETIRRLLFFLLEKDNAKRIASAQLALQVIKDPAGFDQLTYVDSYTQQRTRTSFKNVFPIVEETPDYTWKTQAISKSIDANFLVLDHNDQYRLVCDYSSHFEVHSFHHTSIFRQEEKNTAPIIQTGDDTIAFARKNDLLQYKCSIDQLDYILPDCLGIKGFHLSPSLKTIAWDNGFEISVNLSTKQLFKKAYRPYTSGVFYRVAEESAIYLCNTVINPVVSYLSAIEEVPVLPVEGLVVKISQFSSPLYIWELLNDSHRKFKLSSLRGKQCVASEYFSDEVFDVQFVFPFTIVVFKTGKLLLLDHNLNQRELGAVPAGYRSVVADFYWSHYGFQLADDSSSSVALFANSPALSHI